MSEIGRREVLRLAALAGGGLILGSSNSASAQPINTWSKYEVKPLPFNPAKLRGISEKLIVSHHDKNYAGAVKRISSIQQKISQLGQDAQPFQLGSLKREELIAMNSMILHEYYFDNLGGDGTIGGDIEKAIKSKFGSREAWEHEFRQTGQSLSGGSGWVTLVYSSHDKSLYNVWSSDHTVNSVAGIPILVMDMYEHAYQMDYGPDAKSYIDAFFANINWEQVNKRIENLKIA